MIDIEIIYEDKDCLFINKPAGISVHKDGKNEEYTIADWVIEKYPGLKDVGEPLVFKPETANQKAVIVPKPGIVHRLDKETTGVMLIAKTNEAHALFKKQFQDREIEKIYHAFTYGFIKEDLQTIKGSLGRSRGDIRKWTLERFARGAMREAITEIEVLKRFGEIPYEGKGSTEDGAYTFVEARPKTGRTHQIRVHLKSLNHPIVADSLYASARKPALGFTRLALHARSLMVNLPSGERKTVVAEYPEDFKEAVRVAFS